MYPIFSFTRRQAARVCFAGLLALGAAVPDLRAIVGGSASGTPPDSPEARLDPLGADSAFNFVGALAMFADGKEFRGSAVALSSHWVLTAGHNLDMNADGQIEAGLRIDLHLPGFDPLGYAVTSFHLNPQFTGFLNPDITHDLALLYFEDALPAGLRFPSLKLDLQVGDHVTLAGFGYSGYGDQGFTTRASLSDRRIGENVINAYSFFAENGDPLMYDFVFDDPSGSGSLGNDREATIGPGDSGGALLYATAGGYALAGINTYGDSEEGREGFFGALGGGVLLTPYLDWIQTTTGLALVPEPASFALLLGGLSGVAVLFRRRRRRADLDAEVGTEKPAKNPDAS